MRYTVECYLDRAIRMAPDDVIVRILYAQFLASKSRIGEADAQLQTAAKLAGDDGFTHYNIGLAYLEMKQYDRALAQAHKALALGMTRVALKNALIAAGKWVEPVAADGAASAPPASAASSVAATASAPGRE
jgi:tetratricopeptide (TPR) repeat protein